MGLMEKAREYKNYIIMAGLLVGVLNFFDVLPDELPLSGLEYTKYVYIGIIAFAGYCYYDFHWGTTMPHMNIQRTVPRRELGNPHHKAQIAKQFGKYATPQPPRQAASQPNPPPVRPRDETFDAFNKND